MRMNNDTNNNVLAFLELVSSDAEAQKNLFGRLGDIQYTIIQSAIQAAAEKGITLSPEDFFEGDGENDQEELESVRNALLALCIGCEGRPRNVVSLYEPAEQVYRTQSRHY